MLMRFQVFLFALTAMAFGGCCIHKTPGSPKIRFSAKHPAIAREYVSLNETSLPVIRRWQYEAYQAKVRLLETAGKKLSNSSASEDYVALVKERLKQFYSGEKDFVDQIASEFDESSESLYYYDWRRGDQQEQGWLVLGNDQVLRTYPIAGNRK